MGDIRNFYGNYPVRRFSKGELVLIQGEVPQSVYVIKSGVIKVYNITSQGEEKPISFSISEDIFPLGWVFNTARYAQYYYEAFSNCELYCISRIEYMAHLRQNSDSLFRMTNRLVSLHINQQMRINALEQSKASNKIICTIYFLCVRFGHDSSNGTVRITLPLTQQDLANFMGLTRETTGIELKKLQKQGVLTYRMQRYVVKIDKLAELLDDGYDQGFVE